MTSDAPASTPPTIKIGTLVRFGDGGPVHRVVSVMSDGMIELHDMGGYFAPHLFTVADDVEASPSKTTQDASDDFKKEISATLTGIAQRFDEELLALSEEELASKWFFSWENAGSVAWNIYCFSEMLEIHKRRCRRWEEHHHGSMCVVERVRDKYLMPRVKDFQAEIERRMSK